MHRKDSKRYVNLNNKLLLKNENLLEIKKIDKIFIPNKK